MIPPAFIDDVLARTDIVEIIEPRVTLKKTGRNYSGLCPFHQEKTPSFSVSADKQFYYCFGCQASGSALKFLMEFERLDFVSAVEMLAGRLGLEVPKETTGAGAQAAARRKSIYDILAQATTYYETQLREHAGRDVAVDYLKGRGLTGQIAKAFALGFAPAGWDNLLKQLSVSNETRALLVESGMLIENTDEDKLYDRFRERIMFPIRDLRGRTIAFGGRIIGDGKPKYLNSPETSVFHKGRELYGLHEARRRNRDLTRLIVVEGYMDVVALAQHGINYAVATLGTATTGDHLDRLFRLVNEVVFCFDGDSAGRAAAWKALQTALPHMQDGRTVRFLFLPDGEDPDTLVRRIGHDRFSEEIDAAVSLAESFYAHLEAEQETTTLEGKAALANLAKPYLEKVPGNVLRQLMMDELGRRSGISVDRLFPAARKAPRTQAPASQGVAATAGSRRRQATSRHVLTMLVRQPELATEFSEADYEKLAHMDETLGAVALMILREDLTSPGLLMEHFQGTPQFDDIRAAQGAESLLSPDENRLEYRGTVERLLEKFETQLKQQLIDELRSKAPSQLSEAERELLKDAYRSS